MKLFTTLHILFTVVVPAKVSQARTDPESGVSEALVVAIIAAIGLTIALSVMAAMSSATGSYVSQIHG